MLKNMKIGMRLGLGFAIVLVLMVTVIFVAITNMSKINDNLERIVKINNVRLGLAGTMIDDVREVSIALRNMLLVKDSEKRQEQKKNIESNEKVWSEAIPKTQETI